MSAKKAVFLITNKNNNKHYVGISEDIAIEWFNTKRDIKIGRGIRKMKDDFELYGEDAFGFEIILVTDDKKALHRRESELAYEYNVWDHGYNTEALLNYRTMTDDELATQKLKLYKFIENLDDGKYKFTHLLNIMGLTKNDLEIIFQEITEDEMRYFKKQIFLRNKSAGIENYYIQIKSF